MRSDTRACPHDHDDLASLGENPRSRGRLTHTGRDTHAV
jgi:hypothetical protein